MVLKQKKYTVAVLLLIMLCFTFCRKRCTPGNATFIPLNPELVAYFGVYTQGSYWVYETADHSLKDSAYVTASSRYTREANARTAPCENIEELNFTIKSNNRYLIESEYAAGETFLYPSTFFPNANESSGGLFSKDQVYPINFDDDRVWTSEMFNIVRLSSVKLNQMVYTGKLLGFYGLNGNTDTIYMQENIGVVGWVKNNKTFNLVKYNLKP
jgi:hypothetical protein